MPYGRSNLPAYLAMRDLGNTLYSGLSDIGNRKIQAEDRGFNRMLQENQLGRQAEADTRAKEIYQSQKPGNELRRQEDQQKLDWGQAELSMSDLFPDDLALQHATNVSDKDPSGKSLVQKITDLYGVKYDVDEKSPNRGKFVKEDGGRMKRFELGPKWEQAKELIAANTDKIKLIQSQVYRWQDSLQALQRQGAKDNDPKVVKLKEDIAKASKILKDDPEGIEAQIKILENDYEVSSRFKNVNPAEVKAHQDYVRGRIDKLQDQLRQDKKTKEEQSFRAGESAKDREAKADEARLSREATAEQERIKREEDIVETTEGFVKKKNALYKKTPKGVVTEATLPYREKAKLDTLKEERKAYVKQIAENDMLTTEKKNELQGKIDEIDRLISGEATEKPKGKKVVRTGTDKKTGRKVNQYDDGTVGYAD